MYLRNNPDAHWGKISMWAFSNDLGCSGAAYERIKHEGSETIEVITSVFTYWFCGNYKRCAGRENQRPLDQYSEQLSCIAALPVWNLFGKKGFVGKTTPAEIGEHFMDGEISHHLRDGYPLFKQSGLAQIYGFLQK